MVQEAEDPEEKRVQVPVVQEAEDLEEKRVQVLVVPEAEDLRATLSRESAGPVHLSS